MGLHSIGKVGLILLLLLFSSAAAAGAAPDTPTYTISYTIAPAPDGSAAWTVEYRALLPTGEDITAFERDVSDSSVLPADDVRGVMERSAKNAAEATSRPMEIRNFSVSTLVQTTPTGTYGVIRYSFLWTGFTQPGDRITIGDAFVGGLYLSRETTLVIHMPKEYTVAGASPAPDFSGSDLTWQGVRSFPPGEPRIVLQPPQFPWPVVLPAIAAAGTVSGLVVWYAVKRRKREPVAVPNPRTDVALVNEIARFEDRILLLLQESGGELYQSDITTRLGAPKSTVSSALNILHDDGRIVKVRKGRENLIRLARDENPAGKK
jgi:uncharacterized membrane protein